jgi:hypothetical protein
MKNNRVLTLGYTDYLLPEDISTKQVADLLDILSALSVIQAVGRDVAGRWITAEYTEGVRVMYQHKDKLDVFANRDRAQQHLDNLELQVAQPETMGDAF